MFGDIVRARRRRLGMSQDDLAERAGVSVRGLRKIEANQVATPRPATVRLLADALGLSGEDRDEFCAIGLAEPDERAGAPPTATRPSGRPDGAGSREWSAPAQLPADVAGFTGRSEHVRQLTALLDRQDQGAPRAAVITAIAGTAGVGKTALAVHWGHQVRHRFPHGQLYVNLRGFDPGGAVMNPGEAVRRFLDALDVPPQRIPADPDAQADLYRTLLADRRVLVVLDNARDAEQVRPLLPRAPGCLVLVTSRHQLTSLVAADVAHPIALDLLSPEEAHELLARRLGRDRVAAEPQAVEKIITRCARLPLALAIAAARAATHPDLPLSALAAELGDSRDRLDALTADEDPTTDVRAVFSWSYRSLSPAAARLFRLLSLHPGPDISVQATASLAAEPIFRVRPLLAELARAHLIVEHVPARYTFHDLLRAYAAEQAHAIDPEEERQAAVHRVLDHYLHTAHNGNMLLNPYQEQVDLDPPQPGVTPETLADHQQASAWFATEHAVLVAAVDHATGVALDVHVWQLAWTLTTYLDRRGHWHDWAATQHAALAATQRLADRLEQARAHRILARPYTQLSRLDDADSHLRRALELYREAGDQAGQAHTHTHLGMVLERQGRHAEALEHDRRAHDLHRAVGYRAGQALSLNNIGWNLAQLGDYRQALTCCRQALRLHEELGNLHGQAGTWDSLGYAHHHLGDHAQATICYQRALELYRAVGDRYGEAATLTRIGETHQATGDLDAARAAWRQALDTFEDLEHRDARKVRDNLAALALNTPDLGDLDDPDWATP